MKKIIFLMTIICLFFINTKVNAMEVEFYEAEKIDGIYTKSVGRRDAYFQKSRFFRRKSDNKAAYCIEPFSSFYPEYKYSDIKDIKDISDDVLKKISLIAYYGYNYDNHTEDKWYAITQLMIWRETNKDSDFYFTDTLNGNKIDRFQDEINEINNLVNNHDKLPSFSNQTIDIKYKENYIIDDNNIIDGFTSDNKDIIIDNNRLDISKLEPGKYTINFKKTLIDRGEDILFYFNENSQNLMTIGNSYVPSFTLNINIYNPEIIIEKYDKDNNPTDKLCDASFNLYDKDMNPIREIYLNSDCKAIIDDIDLGTYYIKEIKAGEGYKLNEETFKIDISMDDYKKVLKIYNEQYDYKIEVPDTRSDKKSINLIYIILILFGSIYAKKIYIS